MSPHSSKATQLVVTLAVWTTQRSDPDSNVIIFFVASSLAFYWTIITLLSQRKERKQKTKKRKKRKIWRGGCFGERPNPKITTSFFDFLANGSAALLA
jgi:hypothetical protein